MIMLQPDSLPTVTVDSSNTSSYTSRPRSTYGSSNVTNDYNGNGGGGGGYSYPSSPVKTLPWVVYAFYSTVIT